jgi:hypothetical protein
MDAEKAAIDEQEKAHDLAPSDISDMARRNLGS